MVIPLYDYWQVDFIAAVIIAGVIWLAHAISKRKKEKRILAAVDKRNVNMEVKI
ncbi:MAG: hypothetical protein QXU98_07505 [Candidatus Parvarchaeota archaeon]